MGYFGRNFDWMGFWKGIGWGILGLGGGFGGGIGVIDEVGGVMGRGVNRRCVPKR